MAVELYPHNQETYARMTEMFETSNRVGVVQPTGTGKSFLYLKWIEDHPKDSFAVLSPSNEIFTQLREYAEAAGEAGMLDSVQMISYQSLLRMTDDEIHEVCADKIVLDEFHRTGAEQWGLALQKLLDANPQAQVLGASATPVRYLDNVKDMASELFDRNLAVEMTLGEAVRRDVLPTPKYVPVWFDINGKMEQYEQDISKVKNKEERKEMEELLEQVKRRLENAYGAEDIFKKHMPHDHGKFIVFCRDVGHLEEMKKTVPQWMAGVNQNVRSYVSISAETDKDLQLQAFKDDKGEDAVKLLFTIDRLNEGVHVKGIDGVIMLRPTISPIIYLQQMGRALAAGGVAPLIFDMVNNYQNVQVPLADGGTRNVFEAEFRGGVGSDVEVGDFRIFEDMMEFASMFEGLEDLLYLTNNETWKKTLQKYIDFREKFGCDPSSKANIEEEKILGRWAVNQRRLKFIEKLSPEREQQLLAIGFVFDLLDFEWHRKLDLYISYKKEYGCEPSGGIIYQNEKLGNWCGDQRRFFKSGKLSDSRMQKLRNAGFVFDPLDFEWHHKLDLYSSYKKEYGCEPSRDVIYQGEKFGNWCFHQRYLFKKGKLSDDKIEKLKSVGFDFDPLENGWQKNFCDYVSLTEKLGHFPSFSGKSEEEKFLWNWAQLQRRKKLAGNLSSKHEQQLVAIGFNFNGRKQKFNLDSRVEGNDSLDDMISEAEKKLVLERKKISIERGEIDGIAGR